MIFSCHVHWYMHVFADQIPFFSLLKLSQVSKDSWDAKGGGYVACRDVVEMRAGLGRIIKQVACQGWGTSSRSTWGSLEVNLMNYAWHRLKFIECHKYLQHVHEYVWYVCMHVDTYILRDFCRVKDLGLVSPYVNHWCSCLFRSAGVSPQREQGWVGNSTSWKPLATCDFLNLKIWWYLMYLMYSEKSLHTLGLKKTVSGPPPAALGPPVPRNQRLLGRTPSPARPVPEGPEKPEPRAGGASTWIKVEWGKCLPFPKPSNSLALEMVFNSRHVLSSSKADLFGKFFADFRRQRSLGCLPQHLWRDHLIGSPVWGNS